MDLKKSLLIILFSACFTLFFPVLVSNLSSDSAFPSLPFRRAVSLLFLSFSNWSMAPQAIKQEQTMSHTTSHYNGLMWPLVSLGVWNSVFPLFRKTLNVILHTDTWNGPYRRTVNPLSELMIAHSRIKQSNNSSAQMMENSLQLHSQIVVVHTKHDKPRS